MAFRDFTFPDVMERLDLILREDDMFSSIPPASLPLEFIERLNQDAQLALALRNEKAKSEFIIAPVLLEVRRQFPGGFGLFSGQEFNVDLSRGLNGVFDFIITRSPLQYMVTTPIAVVAEAKNDELSNGYGQCIAGMRAAQIFNQRKGQSPTIHGVVSTGADWQFMRLEGDTITIDRLQYFLNNINKVAAIIRHMIESVALAPVAA